MKMRKSFLAVLLSILFMFSSFVPSIPAYASNNNNVVDVTWQTISKYIQRSTGFIMDNWETGVDFLRNFFNSHKEDYDTDDNFDDFLRQNIYDNGSDSTFSPDVINLFRDCVVNYINNETGYVYGYSNSPSYYLNSFNSQTKYNAFKNFISENDDKLIVYVPTSDYFIIPTYTMSPDFVKKSVSSNVYCMVDVYSNWSKVSTCTYYRYDSSLSQYTEYSTGSFTDPCYLSLDYNSDVWQSAYVDSVKTQYIIYNSTSAMRAGSEGLQEYYVSDSYNTSHVDNSVTYTNDSINNQISYQNISNYVNSYYINNQTYPSSQDTYNYINNYNGDNNGGGSGGGSDDDDDGWDWGFLDTIADFLKGLLKALKTAIEGVLDILTGVIDLFIGEEQPDGSRSGGLPNIIARLVAYFLPFLPDWCTSLIGFSVLLALILGVIKLVRGR